MPWPRPLFQLYLPHRWNTEAELWHHPGSKKRKSTIHPLLRLLLLPWGAHPLNQAQENLTEPQEMGLVFTSQTIFKNFNNINKIVLELSVFV